VAWLKMFKARKEYRCSICGKRIKKGENYYRFAPSRFAEKQIRCINCKPSRSEMTMSDFLSQIYDIEERLAGMDYNLKDIQDVIDELEEIINELEDLKSETEDKYYSLPDQFQDYSPVGELLSGRIDALDEMIEEIEELKSELETLIDSDMSEEEKREEFENILESINGICYSGE